MELKIDNKLYKVLKDYGETISTINLEEYITDFYDNYDYIVGDWAYGKLRLKGFYDRNNNKCKQLNNIQLLDKYLKNNCAYNCKYFILKKYVQKQ